jgi:hypothetical protein
VLERLAPNGEVAHEEDIGEFAVLRNAREGAAAIATPIYDYGMVDDDFLLAPLAARWLLDSMRAAARGAQFLAGKLPGGEARGQRWRATSPGPSSARRRFAPNPRAATSSASSRAHDRQLARQRAGLGRGDSRTTSTPRWCRRRSRPPRGSPTRAAGSIPRSARKRHAGAARERARTWTRARRACSPSTCPRPRRAPKSRPTRRDVGVDAAPALRALGDGAAIPRAVARRRVGPVRILNSDEGFRLLLTAPTSASSSAA